MLGGKKYILADHSLPKEDAKRLQIRHNKLGMNAQVVKHADGKYAVYRRCDLRRMRQAQMKARLKRVHVNQFMIRANQNVPKAGRRPVLSVQTSQGSIRANNVKLEGDSKLKYTPDDKLSCGASVYIETKDPIILDSCARLS